MAWKGSWPPHEVQLSRQRLEQLRDLVNDVPHLGDDTEGALAKFLTVRACGHIEFTFDECVCEFARANSHPAIASHVRDGLFRGRNPHPDVLVKRIGALDVKWASKLDEYFAADDKRRRRELGFLVARRNSISHGQNEGVGARKALDLAELSLELSAWVVDCMNPNLNQ